MTRRRITPDMEIQTSDEIANGSTSMDKQASEKLDSAKSHIIYRIYIKRFFDILLSAIAIIILSPFLLLFTIIGSFVMHGNPFFVQARSGKNERIFNLIKFRTMSNQREANGKLLPDSQRLNKYGKFLRATSIDELPELINIFKGDISIVGPRPLVVEYLPYYTEVERQRFDVKPGLTGLAQVKGRSLLSWEEIFKFDICYVNDISFIKDVGIVIETIAKVLMHKDTVDISKANAGHDGRLHIVIGGCDHVIHEPLNVERAQNYNR